MIILIKRRAYGAALIGLVLSLFIIVAIAFGGFYIMGLSPSSSPTPSPIETDFMALNNAKDLQKIVNQRVRQINNTLGEERLNLSNQGLTSLPADVLSMTQLTDLNLSNNKLTGALPAEIRRLSKLRNLNVSHNQMTGIPAEIGQLSRLETLDHSYNQITGMPYEIGNLTNLKTLNLTGNDFSQQDLRVIKKKLPNLEVIF